MKCPHCNTTIHEGWTESGLSGRPEGQYVIAWQVCPACGGFMVALRRYIEGNLAEMRLVWPAHAVRPVPPEVDGRYADDFRESAAIIALSPKASAAVSRRILQDVLRERGGFQGPNLDAEIQQAIDSATVPSWLSENLDAVRVVGNFAAHPIKSTNSGEVVGVEPGEAEFLLDVLDGLFDFYFVQPERAKQQRDALNAKLADAGKRPLKGVGE